LEGPVDPGSYHLGPGDKLEFAVWGQTEMHEEMLVSPDGRIAVPTIGQLNVAGLTLTAADSLLHAKALSSYPKARTELRLIALRTMKASISGAVKVPGVYEVTAVDRLSALIQAAGGLMITDADTKEEEMIRESTVVPKSQEERRALQQIRTAKQQRQQASLRHIVILSRDGQQREIDLQRFYTTGELRYNPILRDGDQVQVPNVDRQVGVINIFGAVKTPGEYEYISGDRLRTLIDLAGGLQGDAQGDAISIVRFDKTGKDRIELNAALKDSSDFGPELAPDDRVFVRTKPDYRQKYQVVIKGEVLYPGYYSIEEDRTKLSDLIKSCGGLTKRANLYSARVVRRSMASVEDPEFERLKTLTVADMTDMEYEYLKIRSREEAPMVVVNFSKLFVQGDESVDIILQDQDEIEIPTLSPTVKVAGQINNPGLIRYVEGQGYEYYVGKAGGFSWNARTGKLRLIKAHSGMWIKPIKQTPIEIGDTIFVPEKQETDWWELSKDLLLAVSQIATVLIMIRSL